MLLKQRWKAISFAIKISVVRLRYVGMIIMGKFFFFLEKKGGVKESNS